jgi:hypothetical protein
MSDLEQEQHALAQKLYEASAPPPESPEASQEEEMVGATAAKDSDDVIDAEFQEDTGAKKD